MIRFLYIKKQGNDNMKFRFRVVTVFMVITLIFMPVKAYAMDENFVQNTVIWREIDSVIRYDNDGFNGYTKYVFDDENGCFYIYLNFTDLRIDSSSNENIKLNFIIENSSESYSFSADKNGIVDEWAKEKVSVSVNFNASCKNQGGKMIAGVELKDKNAKKLTNYVSCYYSCGAEISAELFENFTLDMYVPTTLKSTAEKKTTTKKSTAKKNKESAVSEKNTSDKATKFSVSNTNSSKKTTTKFSASNSTKFDAASQSTGEQSDDEFWENQLSSVAEINEESDVENTKTKMSSSAKAMLAVSVVLLALGVAFVAAGVLKKGKLGGNSEMEETEEGGAND